MKQYSKAFTPGFLTKHSLRLTGFEGVDAQVIESDLGEIAGIESVSLRVQASSLTVRYDASQVNIDDVILTLNNYGVVPFDSWWRRLKISWQRQMDRNVADSAKHEAHCCNKAPRR